MCRLIVWIAFLGFSVIGHTEMRTFTDAAGRRVEAEVLSINGTSVELRTASGETAILETAAFSSADQTYLKQWEPAAAPDERVTPGAKFRLEFDDLPGTANGQSAGCEISIPSTYRADAPVPLLVWISGGKGSDRIGGAADLVDADRFVIIALPFPESVPSVRDAVGKRTVNQVWDYQRPMLQKVRELIPNLDPEIQIVGGTSNGAHAIGTGFDQDWEGFADGFTGFILHEGGSSPGGDYRSARGKTMLVAYGDKSSALDWQKGFNDRIEHSRPKLDIVEIPGEGHGLGADGRKRIRAWIDEKFPKEG